MAALRLWIEGVAPDLSVRRVELREEVSGHFDLRAPRTSGSSTSTFVSIADHPPPSLDERRRPLVSGVALDAELAPPERSLAPARPASPRRASNGLPRLLPRSERPPYKPPSGFPALGGGDPRFALPPRGAGRALPVEVATGPELAAAGGGAGGHRLHWYSPRTMCSRLHRMETSSPRTEKRKLRPNELRSKRSKSSSHGAFAPSHAWARAIASTSGSSAATL